MPLHAACVMACWLLGMAWQFQQDQLLGGKASAGVAVVLACLVAALAWVLGRHVRGQAMAHWEKAHGHALWQGWPWLRLVLWSVVAALLGWAHAQWQASAMWHMQWPQSLEGQEVMLTGRVDSMPQTQAWGQQFEVAVISVSRLPLSNHSLPDRVSLVWADAPAHVLPGQTWRWAVKLQAPHGRMNPGSFDTERWMFQQGLRAQGKVNTKEAAVMLAQPPWGGPGLIDRWRVQLARQVEAAVPSPDMAGLLVGLTLGQQSAISQDHWQILRNTGIAHLAAISGLHITMVGWLCGVCVGAAWRRSQRLMQWVSAVAVARWATLLGATGYALLAGWGIPAQRTVFMLALVVALQASARRWPWPLVLLLAAVVVTAWDPWALTQVSFWLSFAAVGLLMLASPAEAVAEPTLSMRARLWAHMQALLRTQWVATLGLAPLSLVCFQALSLVGLVVNLVCVPLFTLVITPLALLGYVWPSAWGMAQGLLQSTLSALTPLAQHPAVLWQSAEVHAWAALLALLAAGVWLMPLPLRWRMWSWPAWLFLCWPTGISQKWPPPPPGAMQVVAADVGQGTAVLVRTATHALLFDAGPRLSDTSDMGLKVLVGLLRAMGVGQLDEFMVSHADMDHVGGASAVLGHVRVVGLRTSLTPAHPLLQQADLAGMQPRHVPCQAGQRWQWDGVDFEVLHPLLPPDQIAPALGDNARSCVLKVLAQGQSVLITADLEAPQEAQLLANDAQRLKSDVLLVPHHGSKTSSTEAFLEAVQPRVAVIQAGWRNRYGHPHAQVVARYRVRGVALVNTAHCGAWFWQSDAGGANKLGHCWRTSQRRYWHAPAVSAQMTPL